MIKTYVLDPTCCSMTRSDFQVRRQPRRYSNVVVEELDNFKKSQDMLGQNARRVLQWPSTRLKTRGSLQDGVRWTRRVPSAWHQWERNLIPLMLQGEKRIRTFLGCAIAIRRANPSSGQGKTRFDAVVPGVKEYKPPDQAEALGIRAQDYGKTIGIPTSPNLTASPIIEMAGGGVQCARGERGDRSRGGKGVRSRGQ